MENTKQNKLLYLIAILLVINLFGTLWLVKQVAVQPTKVVSKSTDQESLPDYITSDVRKEIYKKFEESYNSQDADSFWHIFSDFAKSQMNKDDAKKSYNALRDMFSKVSDGVFAYYEFLGRRGNLRTYDLYYNLEIDGEKFSGKGIVKITITDDGKEYGIVSLNLSSQ